MNVQRTVDFKAVSHANYFYKNQYGDVRRTVPHFPTFHSTIVQQHELAFYHLLGPCELLLDKLARKRALDVWTPVIELQLRNNHSLVSVGEKAKKTFKAYNKHIYK